MRNLVVVIPPYVLLVLSGGLLFLVGLARGDSYSDIDERLGVAFEFKVHVDPGKEDCFYQHVQPQSSLYVAFQVSALASSLC